MAQFSLPNADVTMTISVWKIAKELLIHILFNEFYNAAAPTKSGSVKHCAPFSFIELGTSAHSSKKHQSSRGLQWKWVYKKASIGMQEGVYSR